MVRGLLAAGCMPVECTARARVAMSRSFNRGPMFGDRFRVRPVTVEYRDCRLSRVVGIFESRLCLVVVAGGDAVTYNRTFRYQHYMKHYVFILIYVKIREPQVVPVMITTTCFMSASCMRLAIQ